MLRVVIVVLLIALLPSLARAEARIALLIGNQRYVTSPSKVARGAATTKGYTKTPRKPDYLKPR